jgi:uncharacterized protein YndB with AHSA1/START domain
MSKLFLERSIEINVPASKVWRVFADPVLTRQMGGEYATDWQVGSSFGWRGLDGQMLTDGSILKIEAEKLLQHELFDASAPSAKTVQSVITYELREHETSTTLFAREEFSSPITDAEYADAMDGWGAALLALKDVAEK